MKTRSIFHLITLISIVGFIGGCGGGMTGLSEPLFYPAAPLTPRIQFLAALGDVKNPGAQFINFPPQDELFQHEILKPYGMVFTENKLLLSDTKRGGIWVLYLKDRLRRYQKLKSVKRAGKLSGLALDKEGRMYATNIGGNFVQLYNRHNRLVKHLSDIGRPVDVAVYGDKVYVLDMDENTVEVWDKGLDNLEYKIGKTGHNPGEFFMPSSIAVDSEGFLYVVDTGNARVQKFDRQGRFMLSIGQLGDVPGCFMRPRGVAVDRKGNIYVADPMLQYVQLFDPQGNLLLYFGRAPVEELDLRLPAKIILDYKHIDYFKEQTDPGFKLEYLILVSNQLGPNKVNVYGFGYPKKHPFDTADQH